MDFNFVLEFEINLSECDRSLRCQRAGFTGNIWVSDQIRRGSFHYVLGCLVLPARSQAVKQMQHSMTIQYQRSSTSNTYGTKFRSRISLKYMYITKNNLVHHQPKRFLQINYLLVFSFDFLRQSLCKILKYPK